MTVPWTIARGTLKEAMRNRAFLGLTLASLLFILFSLVLSQLSLKSEASRVVVDFGFAAISLFLVAVGVTIGVILVYKEVALKTIYAVLAKPVRRHEFIFGKYLGLTLLLGLELLLLSLAWAGVLALRESPLSLDLAKGLYLVFLEACVVTAAAVMFSAFTSPVFSGLFALGVFGIGRLLYFIEELLAARKGLFADLPALKPAAEFVVRLFPDLGVFNLSHQVLFGVPIPATYLVSATGYALAYVLAFLAIGTLLFQRRDFV
jgi:ABC-type transport system involved in multi-copper enzyme maturation permease subunit